MTRVVNMRNEDWDVRIDRKSRWGNPFQIGADGDRNEVVQKYREWIRDQTYLLKHIENGALKDKALAILNRATATSWSS